MIRSFRIGSLFGIPIKLDLTFLLVLPLFAYLIGLQLGPVIEILNASMGAGIDADSLTAEWWLPYAVGLVAAIGLFVGVVLHELGHSLTAQRYGFPIDSITLWLFGGVAALSEMPEDWRQEFTIAIAGPIVSILVGVVSYALFLVTPVGFDGARFVLAYLAILNVALAGFNMLPAFPMDGGRVLRAFLARSKPYAKATQQAAGVGKFLAILMGLFGLLVSFNIILIGVAFFVYIAASSEAQQVTMKAAFQDVTVSNIMTPVSDLHTVEPDTTIADLLQRMFSERHTGYPVVETSATDEERLIGLVTLSDARTIDPVERDAYTVEDVMTTDLKTISPESDAMTAIERMRENNIGRLLVVEGPNHRSTEYASDPGQHGRGDGDLVGLISRTDLMTAFDIVQKSGAVTPAAHPRTAD
ncbi:CBS domain-containing protein [Natrarchaeobius halalkaliphilus]|uniref:Zinc metalloprotease n=1 Tax=Natrarchaeobius halalkaliphilus TaxID=1679091 RepID=A0A3N6MG75_9EURY|nr:CBS domain-containing protein [Natrarchaeobius halalkaliphilus]RQG92936.1 CBS domain-containing protein [Natrarchaeobius halalkaliphilus]